MSRPKGEVVAMKKFAAFLVILSVGLFTFGCSEPTPPKSTPKATPAAPAAGAPAPGAAAPAAPAPAKDTK